MKRSIALVLATLLAACGGCPPVDPGTPQIVTARIAASSTQGTPPLVVSLSAAGSTSLAGAINKYQWEIAGQLGSEAVELVRTFTAPGLFRVKLTVTDAAGNVGVDQVDVRVTGANPTAVIVASPDRGSAPLVVSFDGTGSSSPDDTIRDYYWDFGDGVQSRLASPSYRYARAGQFTVTLRVVTAGGAEGETTAQINVGAGGGSLQFDGNEQATLPVSPEQTLSTYTIELWARADVVGGTLLSVLGGQLRFELLPVENLFRIRRGDESGSISVAGLSSNWQHFALVYDAGVFTLYANGAEAGTLALAGDTLFDTIVAGPAFDGRLSEVRLWTSARTAAQIAATLEQRLSGVEAGLLANWPLDEGTGQTLKNTAPLGADGFRGDSDAIDSADPAWSSDSPQFR